ncbi:MAG TPA: MaoC family dehydratase [Polyangia bacterium]|nr:MaoC family dehydratase [Polyangia bacterium]
MRYLEDLTVGMTFEHGSRTLTRDEIIEFARTFDPQPFHLDEAAAARSIFGRLVASGWHTAALCQRLLVEAWVGSVATLGSPGVDELRWLRPVHPGDALTLHGELLAVTPSRSKPDRGSVRARYQLRNQAGAVVLSMIGIGLVARRPGPVAGPAAGPAPAPGLPGQ